MHLLAVDPGDVHNGVGYFRLEPEDRRLVRLWTRSWRAETLYEFVDSLARYGATHVVCESFHLYPEMAREQGYSTFPTVERIGVVKYICDQRGIPYSMQPASLKKPARRIGERLAPALGSMRMIGSARGSYKGWDWVAPNQHERDATCHAVHWAFRNPLSPMRDMDLKRPRAALAW